MNTLRKIVLSGLGTGYLPAGGTWASALAAGIFLAVAQLCCGVESGKAGGAAEAGAFVNIVTICLALLSSYACVLLGRWAEETYGKKDPHQCTIDECAGQWLALVAVPIGLAPRWLAVLVALVTFRFFDIVKPSPARRLEKLPYGWGILLDDLVAGVYANLATQLILRYAIHYFKLGLHT